MSEQLSEVVYHYGGDPILDVIRVSLGNGKALHWLEVQGGRAGVAIVATDGRRVLLQRQWRSAVESHVWQLPRGFGEADALEDATRELREETSIETTRLRVIGRLLPDPGILSGAIVVVEARVSAFPALSEIHPAQVDPLEQIDAPMLATPDDIEGMIVSGRLIDGITLAALQIWRAVPVVPN